METFSTAFAGRSKAVLSWAVLPCLAATLLLGCGGHKGMPLINVNSFTPSSGTAGTPVTISGSGLTNVSFVAVGEGAVTQWTLINDTQINFTLPASATTGGLTLNDSQDNITTPQVFTVLPQVVGLAPASGPLGTEVKLTGAGFLGATQVLFGGETAAQPGSAFTVVNANQINAYVGSDASTGPVQVTVGGTTVTGPTFTVTP